ncbi:MAG TPA: TonB family protein [Vicinamibacterales bacterium]|nr:TonB family protein [Vicinamibacterales bacterium]
MQEAVSAILHDRAREAEGINRMLMLSIGAHILIVGLVWLSPTGWRSRPAREAAVMELSLGGMEGPNTGGMTAMAGRAVDEIAKPNTPKVDAPPPPKAPEMTESTAVAKPRPTPTKPATRPEPSKSRTPTAGPEIKTGSARVNTGGAAIPFGGLAQGGGGAGGVQLDVKNFCCPEYLALMVQRIRQNWDARQGAGGKPTIKFTIRRDGMLTNVELEKPSGQDLLDLEARRAVIKTMQLPPLPREFTENSLTVHLTFDFQR